MSEEFGTLAWARRTGGEISPEESRRLLGRLLSFQLSMWAEQFAYLVGLSKPISFTRDLAELAPPDTDAVRCARAACEAVAPEYLVNHSERSYLWGRILAEQQGLTPDPELFYASAMFHDTGLTESRQKSEGRPACFTLLSIEDAERQLGDIGFDDARIETVSVAIAMHLNMGVDIAYGPEAVLLNQATSLDVAGMRIWRVSKESRQTVLDAHPRRDQNRALSACWCHEASLAPNSRAGWYERRIQFSKRVAKAPFDS